VVLSGKPVLLFDTYGLFFRSFYALPRMTTSTGQPTSALYGLCTLLLKFAREHRPSALAFALDAPRFLKNSALSSRCSANSSKRWAYRSSARGASRPMTSWPASRQG
jgi:5'-3' exonuclease